MSISITDDLTALRWVQRKIRREDSSSESLMTRLTAGPYRHQYTLSPSFTPQGGMSVRESIVDFANRLTKEPSGPEGLEEAGSSIPAGYTYFGQFVTHDLSLFGNRRILQDSSNRRLGNLRSPRFDLDSVYGQGPVGSPFAYRMPRRSSGAHLRGSFLLSVNRSGEDDLSRSVQGAAAIPDHRNDENVLVSQVHLAIQKAHNRILQERLLAPEQESLEREFFQAREQVIWNYQWLVFHDYLQRVLDPEIADELKAALAVVAAGSPPMVEGHVDLLSKALLKPGPWLPIEFVLAGMRFGHAMVRTSYALNDKTSQIAILPKPGGGHYGQHLQGGQSLVPQWTVDWDLFFDSPKRGRAAAVDLQYSSPIRPKLTHLLGTLPPGPLRSMTRRSNLAVLTLTLGLRFGLASGQHIAKQMQESGLDVGILDESTTAPIEDALWPYVLREAEHEHCGNRLGRVGSWILLQSCWSRLVHDRESFLYARTPYAPKNWPDGASTILEFLKLGDQEIQLRNQ